MRTVRWCETPGSADSAAVMSPDEHRLSAPEDLKFFRKECGIAAVEVDAVSGSTSSAMLGEEVQRYAGDSGVRAMLVVEDMR
jgi:hypothetical protein